MTWGSWDIDGSTDRNYVKPIESRGNEKKKRSKESDELITWWNCTLLMLKSRYNYYVKGFYI